MAKRGKKGVPGGSKAKPSPVKKTDGKESTSALGAEVVVEQPPVDKTGGETESESTRVVASSKRVPLNGERFYASTLPLPCFNMAMCSRSELAVYFSLLTRCFPYKTYHLIFFLNPSVIAVVIVNHISYLLYLCSGESP